MPSGLNVLLGVVLGDFIVCVVILFTLLVRHIVESIQTKKGAHVSTSLQAVGLWILQLAIAFGAGWLLLQLVLGHVMLVHSGQ